MIFKTKQAAHPPHTRKRIDLSMTTVREVMEGAYFVQQGTYDTARIEGGYAFDVFGDAGDGYWRDSEEIDAPGYRVHIQFNSDPIRETFKPGEIGSGRFHKEYAEVWLSLDPAYIRDILYELRRDPRRELRVAGDTTSDEGFRVTLFMLSPPRE